MNGPEILHLIRRDLQRAVARRGSHRPPTNGRLTLGRHERDAEGDPPGT